MTTALTSDEHVQWYRDDGYGALALLPRVARSSGIKHTHDANNITTNMGLRYTDLCGQYCSIGVP